MASADHNTQHYLSHSLLASIDPSNNFTQSLQASHQSQLTQQQVTLATEHEANKQADILESARLHAEEVSGLKSSLHFAQTEAETLRSDHQSQLDELTRHLEVLPFAVAPEPQL